MDSTQNLVGFLADSSQNLSRHAYLMLRYDISELRKMAGGVEMRAAEAAERNRNVLLCRVKTWPQLMCCALV